MIVFGVPCFSLGSKCREMQNSSFHHALLVGPLWGRGGGALRPVLVHQVGPPSKAALRELRDFDLPIDRSDWLDKCVSF